jgi:predicted sulfurtransferase
MEYEADLRWFDAYPPCRQCGKPSAGRLMDVRNTNYGDHCKKCADKRLKHAKAYREHQAATARVGAE